MGITEYLTRMTLRKNLRYPTNSTMILRFQAEHKAAESAAQTQQLIHELSLKELYSIFFIWTFGIVIGGVVLACEVYTVVRLSRRERIPVEWTPGSLKMKLKCVNK